MDMNRRNFIKTSATATFLGCLPSTFAQANKALFDISLAQWSLHKMLHRKELDNLDFPKFTKETFDIHAVEYVNRFFKSTEASYLSELKKRCEDNGVKSLLIMCDGLGQLGAPDDAERKKAVENHYPWLDAAKHLGCHSIRVNAASGGSYDEQLSLAADGLARLSTHAETMNLNVIVENHGGLSSNGEWLAGVMKKVNLPNCGTLPDFGNFRNYDRYKGTKELMPFAKGVSAKSHDFDENGNEIHSDFTRLIKIVLDAGYRGYVGIEYEGNKLSEVEGIKKTKALLIKVRSEYKALVPA